MRKTILCLISMIIFAQTAHADWYLYRKNGGQILARSTESTTWNEPAESMFGVIEWPAVSFEPGNEKVHDSGVVRDATPLEVASFPDKELEDEIELIKAAESAALNDNSNRVMAIKGLALVTLDELNRIIDRIVEIEGCIDNANNLSDVKTCSLLLSPKPFANRTKAQIIPAIQGKINANQAL